MSAIAEFRDSFYNLYFQDVSDYIVEAAIDEVSKSGDSKLIKANCSKLYNRYLALNAMLFLKAVNPVEEIVCDEEGNETVKLSVDSFSSPVKISHVSSDKVYDTQRVFTSPKDDPSRDVRDVPITRIKSELDSMYESCTNLSRVVCGVGSGIVRKKGSKFCNGFSNGNNSRYGCQ